MARRVRVRVTKHTYVHGQTTQVHLTGRDLIQMEDRRRDDIAQITQEATERHTTAMGELSGRALLLHTTPHLAWGAFGLTVVLALLTFTGIPFAYVAPIALAFLDFHNLSTLHGLINWPLLKYTKGQQVYWLAVAVAVFVSPLMAGIYLVQAATGAPQMRDAQRSKVAEHIAQLEAELGNTH